MTTGTDDKYRLSYNISDNDRRDWALFFLEMAAMIPASKPDMSISAHAEKFRVMPRGERFQGPLRLSRNPYLREIMDNMAPDSNVRHTIVMKGAQLGFTMALECILCYYIGYAPADQLLVTATAQLYKRWVGRRLEPAISSYGYRDRIFAQEKRKGNKQTGDKLATKEYIGGQLDLVSAQSAADLRSLTKRILLRDEIDGAKEELDTGEGSFLSVSEARTYFWGDLAKIIDVSTPTTEDQSAIFSYHEEGDKRKYFVPCPYCEKFQPLFWDRFKADTTAGKIDQIYCECDYCSDAIFEHHKAVMFPSARWEPTAEAKKDRVRSYQLPGWYAPIGANKWLSIYNEFMEAQGNPEKMRAFTNLQKGEPYRDEGARPSREKVMLLRGSYKSKTVPYGVLFLTMAVDVQRGSKIDKNNPPRVEFEVCGHGAGYRTWSIDYGRIEGDVQNSHAGAWEELYQYICKTVNYDAAGNLVFSYRRDDGHVFPVHIIFVDSTDGVMSNIVYSFCSRMLNTYPIIGSRPLKKRKGEKKDDEHINATADDVKYYRIIKNRADQWVYSINTNKYKQNLYGQINFISRRREEPQQPGFCDFPRDYGDRYFEMLRAEELRKDGTFYAGGRRNEALDCRVYNMCAGHVYLGRVVEETRKKHAKKYTKEQLEYYIDYNYALAYLSKKAGIKYEQPGITEREGKSA
jgi:phage terminase large subunit GpA-like protein